MTEQQRIADEELLASLGYKQEFQRAFTPHEVFGVAFTVIGLLPSIASTIVYALPNGGTSSLIWGWLVASIFILFVGMAMAELGSSQPTSGGLYFWTYSLASPRSRNLLAWVVGYANTVGSVASIASIDWGCAAQIAAAAAIGSDQGWVATNAQTFGIFTGLVVSHAMICCLATRVLARLQTIYMLSNVILCFVVIIALPIATPSEYKNTASFAFGNFSNFNGWPNGYAFILSFLAPSWTICFFDSSVHISEEASNAAIAVPWAIVNAIAIAGILGWAINVSLAFCMGTNIDMILASNVGQPIAQIFLQSFGKKGTLGLWSIVVITQYMMGSSMVLAASRQSFAFARDGALPFSSYLYRMNSYTGTPVNTVWFACILAILLGLLAFAGGQAVSAVFSLSVVALYVAYAIPIICRFAFTNNFKPGPFSLGAFSLPVATIAVLYMAFMSTVFLFPTMPNPSVTKMNFTVVVLGGILFLSLVYYYLPKYGGKYWFTGPIQTIDQSHRTNQTEYSAKGGVFVGFKAEN